MSVLRGHVLLLFIGGVFWASKYSVEAHKCKNGCSPFHRLTPLLKPTQDPVEVENVSHEDYEDVLGKKGISNNYGLLKNVGLSGLQFPARFIIRDAEEEGRELKQVNESPKAKRQERTKREEELKGQANPDKPELEDEHEEIGFGLSRLLFPVRFLQRDAEEEGRELKQVNESPKAKQQERTKREEELKGKAKPRKPELEDEHEEIGVDEEEEDDGEESVGSPTSGGSSGRYVMRGKYLYMSNWRGVRLRVSSPFKQQRIVMKGKTVTINGRMVCNDIRKLRKKQTHQIAQDGAKWYTNLKVGKPMTKAEIQQFKREGAEREEEEGRKLTQQTKMDEVKRYLNLNVGKPTTTIGIQQFRKEGNEREEEEDEGSKMQLSVGGTTQKQEEREQRRREKDQNRDLKRRQEEEEKLWLKGQRERVRQEKRLVKDNAHNQKEALKEKLRELENTGLEEIRRQKDGIRDKLRAQKSYLKEIETKV